MRFCKPMSNSCVFVDILENVKIRDFGHFLVGDVEWVFNDWYLRKDLTHVLGRFSLITHDNNVQTAISK